MRSRNEKYLDLSRLNWIVVKTIWACVLIIVSVEVFNGYLYKYVDTMMKFQYDNYLYNYVLLPSSMLFILSLSTTLVCKLFNHKHPTFTSYLVSLIFPFYIFIIGMIHFEINGVFMIFAVPIFITLLYNNKTLTFLVSLLSISLVSCLYFFYLPTKPIDSYRFLILDFAATFGFLAGCFVITIIVMNSYNELTNKIEKAYMHNKTLTLAVNKDSFSKLYNREFFDKKLADFVSDFAINQNPFSMMILDVDNFKSINDNYGHAFGDIVLLRLVECITTNIRNSDLAFRYGGEEFVVLLDTNCQNSFNVAEKIRKSFQDCVYEEQKELCVTVSIGVDEYSFFHHNTLAYFQAVDKALYSSKQSGKNKTTIAS